MTEKMKDYLRENVPASLEMGIIYLTTPRRIYEVFLGY